MRHTRTFRVHGGREAEGGLPSRAALGTFSNMPELPLDPSGIVTTIKTSTIAHLPTDYLRQVVAVMERVWPDADPTSGLKDAYHQTAERARREIARRDALSERDAADARARQEFEQKERHHAQKLADSARTRLIAWIALGVSIGSLVADIYQSASGAMRPEDKKPAPELRTPPSESQALSAPKPAPVQAPMTKPEPPLQLR